MGKGGDDENGPCGCICCCLLIALSTFISGCTYLPRGLKARDDLDRDYTLDFQRLDQDCVILEVWTRQGSDDDYDDCDDQYVHLFAYETTRSDVVGAFADQINSSYIHPYRSSSYQNLPWWYMLANASEQLLASVSGWSTASSRVETRRRPNGGCDGPIQEKGQVGAVRAGAASSYWVGDTTPCWIPRPGVVPIEGYNCADIFDNKACVKIFNPGEELELQTDSGDHNDDIKNGIIMISIGGCMLLCFCCGIFCAMAPLAMCKDCCSSEPATAPQVRRQLSDRRRQRMQAAGRQMPNVPIPTPPAFVSGVVWGRPLPTVNATPISGSAANSSTATVVVGEPVVNTETENV